MKGIIFNLLEQAVIDEHGEDAWEMLLDKAGLDGAWTAVGTYPHQDLHKVVDAASEALGLPHDDIVRWFGRVALPMLAQKYPDFFSPHSSVRDFALTLNDIIHPEVRKLFPGAYAPSFVVDETNPGALSLAYESHRGLCLFAEGLLEGAAEHYGEQVNVGQSACTKRGDSRCVLTCEFVSG